MTLLPCSSLENHRMLPPLLFLAALLAPAAPQEDDPLASAVQHALEFSAARLDAATGAIASTRYPSETTSSGTWATTGSSAWTSGFFPGCLWLSCDWSGEARWRSEAEALAGGARGREGRLLDARRRLQDLSELRERLPADGRRRTAHGRARWRGFARDALQHDRARDALVERSGLLRLPGHHRQHDEPRDPVLRSAQRRRSGLVRHGREPRADDAREPRARGRRTYRSWTSTRRRAP